MFGIDSTIIITAVVSVFVIIRLLTKEAYQNNFQIPCGVMCGWTAVYAVVLFIDAAVNGQEDEYDKVVTILVSGFFKLYHVVDLWLTAAFALYWKQYFIR